MKSIITILAVTTSLFLGACASHDACQMGGKKKTECCATDKKCDAKAKKCDSCDSHSHAKPAKKK